MQDGVGERDVTFTEVEKTLFGMGRLEKLVLGIGFDVSLKWYNIVVTKLCQCLSARHAIVTCGPSVTWCLCVCTYVSKWRSTCWECGLM